MIQLLGLPDVQELLHASMCTDARATDHGIGSLTTNLTTGNAIHVYP